MKKTNIIKLLTFIVLFCIYIFPMGIINTKFPIDKLIFVIVVFFTYFYLAKNMHYTKKEVLFVVIIIILMIITKNVNFITFITIPLASKLIEYKKTIKEYLLKSNILYVCLSFTLFYSLLFWGTSNRYAFSAIKEINQSGLAIFCLAMLLMKKNKKIGLFTLLFGLLTISRTYYVAVIIYVLSKTKICKKIANNIKIIKFCNYTNVTIISSILLILLGIFYIYEYKEGNVFWGDNVSSRLYTFLDYSNFFRFVAVINLIFSFKYVPYKLLVGITEQEFIEFGKEVSNEFNVPYKYVVPHNLFYSHLKMYGLFSIIETIYVSEILKKIVNKCNFYIYLAIAFYSIILGAGLYSYWLYLTIFTIFINEE